MDCSVVVPVYNSEGTLAELIDRLGKVLPTVAENFEAILVNDGSRDHSWEVICQLAGARAWVRGINLSRNFGQHSALLAGIRAVAYEIIVTMDDDLQNPPEEIPKLIKKLNEGHDVVYGTPEVEQHGFARVFVSQIARLVLGNALGIERASSGTGFRAFRARLRDAFADYHSPPVVIDLLLTWGTMRFAAIPVRHDRRKTAKSNYSFLKLGLLTLDVITGLSARPLRIAGVIGFGLALLGLVVFFYASVRHFVAGMVLNVDLIISAIAIFSGAQLLALGIIGEYLARMHFSMMGRPSYVERERTESKLNRGERDDV